MGGSLDRGGVRNGGGGLGRERDDGWRERGEVKGGWMGVKV